MDSERDSAGIHGQKEYEKYLLKTRKVSEKRARDNVSLLKNAARIVGCRLTPDMVATKSQIEKIAEKLRGKWVSGSINDCKTALRHYCRALNKKEPR